MKTTRLIKTTLLVLFAFVLHITAADDRKAVQGEQALKQATDKFMMRITTKQICDGVNELLDQYWFDRSDLTKAKAKTCTQFEVELVKGEIILGKPLPKSFEFLGVKRIGKDVVRFVYIQKFENFFAPWSFTFYRGKDEFKMVDLAFGDPVIEDLKSFTVIEHARQ